SIGVYQVAAVPIDTDRASLARRSGGVIATGAVPRALLSLPPTGDGEFDLSQARDPSMSAGGGWRAADGARPIDLWIDLHVPAPAPAGTYRLSVELLERP